ncbi:MAG: hypothetical protein IPL01_09380 [Acidobacteria bacterium]|nr:hypothetical protein [Acidobacteriota bacterium]
MKPWSRNDEPKRIVFLYECRSNPRIEIQGDEPRILSRERASRASRKRRATLRANSPGARTRISLVGRSHAEPFAAPTWPRRMKRFTGSPSNHGR